MACNRVYAVRRRSAKSALDGVKRATVGPDAAVRRHTVLAAFFIKMGSDAVYAVHGAVPKGKVGG